LKYKPKNYFRIKTLKKILIKKILEKKQPEYCSLTYQTYTLDHKLNHDQYFFLKFIFNLLKKSKDNQNNSFRKKTLKKNIN
jgi:hypothetical protein